MGVEIASVVDDWRCHRFRKKGSLAWARHEGFCGECKRLVPLVKRLTATLDRPGIAGMVLVAHKRYIGTGYQAGGVSLADCQGSGRLPVPEPDLLHEPNDTQRAV